MYNRVSVHVACSFFSGPKKNGSWRMCVNYWEINNIKIKYRHAIPHLVCMLERLRFATIFSNIDLKSGYHQVWMCNSDAWTTVFNTKQGLYEWLVMPFCLTNSPSTFMSLMNQILCSFIGCFIVFYFEHILVYCTYLSDNVEHLEIILETFLKEKLYVNLQKYIFCTDQLVFLGFVTSS